MQNANVTNNPHLIFNCDETGLPLEFKPSKVVGRKGIRSVYSVTSGKKGQVTLLVCANTASRRTKHFIASAPAQWNIMFSGKRVDEADNIYQVACNGRNMNFI